MKVRKPAVNSAASGGAGPNENSSSAGPVAVYEPALFDKLTAREQAFVQHPLVLSDPAQAARDVGYSESFANSKAYIKRKQLMYFIRPEMHKRMAKSGVTLDRIHEELAAIAFANEADFYERRDSVDGEETLIVAKDPTLIPEPMQRAIEQINPVSITLNGVTIPWVTYVLHDKKPALKMLAEMLGGFDPRSREPADSVERRRQAELFEFMKPDEIEMIVKIYQRAEKRQKAAATDAEVIEGTKE